ncbi:hypothetical protein [Halodesulfovibrio marinisediminis]|uniref:Ethanolamine utilization cobalamin adenosyltransferase n=1 Tax=Halodesulfovibrio marinisediminis DSM 17456 TaxID=1121457 RepID=A0A1N6GY71_9BACT|nr:hypothetical protein [Halodesulfovibrio marinisediminis]SIO12494.1 Ethanolamine utilization cobalamin adenosyltransferase [Halodesulfovibrio marinisediminis DSM 17456]
MKFITEDDLRTLYRKEAFTDFNVTKDVKLTPGARQFLTDRRITILLDGVPSERAEPSPSTHFQAPVLEKKVEPAAEAEFDWKKKRLSAELKSIANTFLLIACELQARDITLSQSVAVLEREVSAMHAILDEDAPLQDLDFEECRGITKENFSTPLADCFEITSEHMLPPNGKEVLLLNKLRSAMHMLEATVLELYGTCSDENSFCVRVSQIRNVLSQMICTALGGRECQRVE